MTVVNAPSGTSAATLTSGYSYDLKNSLSVRANPLSGVVSTVFRLDGAVVRVENAMPYSIAGDTSAGFTAWRPNTGSHTLVATPYTGTNGTGKAGASVTVPFTVVNTAPPSRKSLLNVSVRANVQTGTHVLIGGFIVTGSSKKVTLRGIGPSLAASGITGTLANPRLDLYNSTGGLVASDDNWSTSTNTPASLKPTDTREAAITATLAPGSYTAILQGVNGSSGVAVFELYDLDPAHGCLANLSSRGRVTTGQNVIIGGFIVGGDQATKVIIRALGPSLNAGGIADALTDPVLELHDSNGALIFSNDSWKSDQAQQVIASGVAPTNDREAAIVATLQPGNYTSIVRGAGGSTGVGMVEVYNLDR